MQLILKSHRSNRFALTQTMSQLSPFEMQIYFRALMFLADCMRELLMSTLFNYNCGLGMTYAFQLM